MACGFSRSGFMDFRVWVGPAAIMAWFQPSRTELRSVGDGRWVCVVYVAP